MDIKILLKALQVCSLSRMMLGGRGWVVAVTMQLKHEPNAYREHISLTHGSITYQSEGANRKLMNQSVKYQTVPDNNHITYLKRTKSHSETHDVLHNSQQESILKQKLITLNIFQIVFNN